jgi:hypothetical protein
MSCDDDYDYEPTFEFLKKRDGFIKHEKKEYIFYQTYPESYNNNSHTRLMLDENKELYRVKFKCIKKIDKDGDEDLIDTYEVLEIKTFYPYAYIEGGMGLIILNYDGIGFKCTTEAAKNLEKSPSGTDVISIDDYGIVKWISYNEFKNFFKNVKEYEIPRNEFRGKLKQK